MCDEHTETREALVLVFHEPVQGVALRNAIVHQKSIIHNYGRGVYLGRAEEVTSLDGTWPRNRTVAALKFDTMEEAVRWFNCDSVFKQPDFLGTTELVAIPLTTPFPCGYPTVLMSNVNINDKECFFGKYKESHQQSIKDHGGMTRIAGTENVKNLRGSNNIGFCSIDLFPARQNLQGWEEARKDHPMGMKRKLIAPGQVVAFELQTSE